MTVSILPNLQPEVNPLKPVVPSLVYMCQSSPSNASDGEVWKPERVFPYQYTSTSSLNRKQKRCKQRLVSFCTYLDARGYQLIRLDLTSGPESSYERLVPNLGVLLKRVKRYYGYDVLHFFVKTREGNGVLHMVWAIKCAKAVWIDQGWLSAQWLDIHGAQVTWIRRMGKGKRHAFGVANYLVTHYLAGQGRFDRYDYSWKKLGFAIGKAWSNFKRGLLNCDDFSLWCGISQRVLTIHPKLKFKIWDLLLRHGSCICGPWSWCLANPVPVRVYVET